MREMLCCSWLCAHDRWPSLHCYLQANAELAVREMLVAFSQEQGLPEVRRLVAPLQA